MYDPDRPEPSLLALHRIPNGLVVLLTVALLLQGPVGAFEAIWAYTTNLVATLFGGEDLFWEVLCQTAPLVVATAAIALVYRSGKHSIASPTLLVVSSVMVLAAIWIGGELRTLTAKPQPLFRSQTPVILASVHSDNHVLVAHRSLRKPDDEVMEPETISVAKAIEHLSDFHTPATDGSHHRWTQGVPRVALIPETGSVPGFVSRTINQILGYFVVYRPRLFLAAILLGAYVGWSWQPYAQSLRSWVRSLNHKTALESH